MFLVIQSTRGEVKDKQVITVRAQDIPDAVQILGRLGQPLGSLATIRGTWMRPSPGPAKDNSLFFRVVLADAKQGENIEFLEGQIYPIFTRRGHGPGPGYRWDWRFDGQGKESPPEPLEGETWEMLGVETGYIKSYSAAVWKEIGIHMQWPGYLNGFVTRFEYIAIRRLPKGDPLAPGSD